MIPGCGVYVSYGQGYSLDRFLEVYGEEELLQNLDCIRFCAFGKVTGDNGIKLTVAASPMNTIEHCENPIERLKKIDSILKELT